MNFRQIILIRTDLDMGCGKKCVQVAHASIMACDKSDQYHGTIPVNSWKEEGMRKIVLKVPSLEDLEYIERIAESQGIISAKVVDLGLTQLAVDTITALGFEPLDDKSPRGIILAGLTRELKLL